VKSEKIKSIGGSGGLRCGCCGQSGGRHRAAHKRGVRSMVRSVRKGNKARAIREGLAEIG